MKTIGILGGTFDPIHNGHLHIARQVFTNLALDEIHFLPCAIPVHREPPKVDEFHRQKMIELAIAGQSGFQLNTAELDRGGQSYMIDTLRRLCQWHQAERFYLVLGADAFSGFHLWKSSDEILELVSLVICRRPGIDFKWASYLEHRIETPSELKQKMYGCILSLEIEQTPCASSQIRQQILNGNHNQAAECLPNAVLDYIMSNQLYE